MKKGKFLDLVEKNSALDRLCYSLSLDLANALIGFIGITALSNRTLAGRLCTCFARLKGLVARCDCINRLILLKTCLKQGFRRGLEFSY